MGKLNFSISELIKSETANLHNINNMPDINSLDNMLDLIYYVLQPIRDRLKKPMVITSGFRCKRVNELLNGAKTSQHLKGQAADFIVPGMAVDEVIQFIRNSYIEYDQLIAEKNGSSEWVHISFSKDNNRNQFLRITK